MRTSLRGRSGTPPPRRAASGWWDRPAGTRPNRRRPPETCGRLAIGTAFLDCRTWQFSSSVWTASGPLNCTGNKAQGRGNHPRAKLGSDDQYEPVVRRVLRRRGTQSSHGPHTIHEHPAATTPAGDAAARAGPKHGGAKMTGRQVVGRIALAALAVGLLAAAGDAVYRLGFSAGVASAGPMGDLRSFMSERGPRFGWPDQFDPFLQE